MNKPLSEMLEAMEPHPIAKDATLVPRATYDRMKRVAIELAKQMEIISGKHNEFCVDDLEDAMFSADECLSRAKDIIGGKDE